MSGSEPSSHDEAPAYVVDVLLAFDTTTLLDRHPDASLRAETPTLTDPDSCYLLSSGLDELTARNDGRLRIVAPIGTHLHLRSSTLAIRSEHLVLVSAIHLMDEHLLSSVQLVVCDGAVLTLPPADESSMFVRRPTVDHYWQVQVQTHGSVDAQIDIIVIDRAGETLGCFRWPLVIEVVAP